MKLFVAKKYDRVLRFRFKCNSLASSSDTVPSTVARSIGAANESIAYSAADEPLTGLLKLVLRFIDRVGDMTFSAKTKAELDEVRERRKQQKFRESYASRQEMLQAKREADRKAIDTLSPEARRKLEQRDAKLKAKHEAPKRVLLR